MNEHLNPEGLVLSARYRETMEQEVLPFLAARETVLTVEGADGRPLYVCRYPAEGSPRGTVVIVHGFTENALKYAELIHSLLRNGFSVVAYDQRGHGRSWRREDLKDPSLTHVDHFGEYVEDLECVCRQALKGMPAPRLLLAHSMGGAVGGLFLEKHPRVFERAVLCSPMIAVNSRGLPVPVGKLICRAAFLTGKAADRVFFSRPYTEKEVFETSCATGRERFDWYEELRFRHPEFHNNGPSYAWVMESLKVTKRLLAPGAPERIDCPLLLFSAEDDREVLPEAQEAFIRRIRQGSRRTVAGTKHEIYRSADQILFPWWREVLAFLKGNSI